MHQYHRKSTEFIQGTQSPWITKLGPYLEILLKWLEENQKVCNIDLVVFIIKKVKNQFGLILN